MARNGASNTGDRAQGTGKNQRKQKKTRLDDLLVERGMFPDRDAALRAVLAHEVRVDDVYPQSAAVMVRPDADVFVRGRKSYVSRGGYKLAGALEHFAFDVKDKSCIDIGSSTGGFTDCLLQAGAGHVSCVDVNYGELAWKLREDERVSVFERTNIRTANPDDLGAPFDVLVADLSFIGLAGLAGTFAELCHTGSTLIALVKPQFESMHEETDRGIVQDEAVRMRVVEEVMAALVRAGFRVQGFVPSQIKGTKGNQEYLVKATFGLEGSDSNEAAH